jgi:hypothetical protein
MAWPNSKMVRKAMRATQKRSGPANDPSSPACGPARPKNRSVHEHSYINKRAKLSQSRQGYAQVADPQANANVTERGRCCGSKNNL